MATAFRSARSLSLQKLVRACGRTTTLLPKKVTHLGDRGIRPFPPKLNTAERRREIHVSYSSVRAFLTSHFRHFCSLDALISTPRASHRQVRRSQHGHADTRGWYWARDGHCGAGYIQVAKRDNCTVQYNEDRAGFGVENLYYSDASKLSLNSTIKVK